MFIYWTMMQLTIVLSDHALINKYMYFCTVHEYTDSSTFKPKKFPVVST